MKNIAENVDFLKVLCCCNKKLFKNIINGSNQKLILCLCECVLNCLNGNIDLNETEKHQLKKYKKVLRELIKKKISLKKRKQLLLQKGSGFLPIILPTVLSLLTDFLTQK